MRMFHLLRRHLARHLLDRDRGVGIAADIAQPVPQIGAREVGRGQAKPHLVVPADTRLRPGMPLHRAAQIPLEGADVVLLDPQTQGVHNADQLFCLGIARTGGGPKRLFRRFKIACVHQIAGIFDIGARGGGQRQNRRHQPDACPRYNLHALCLSLAALPGAAAAQTLQADDFLAFDADQARIGQLLFYDKILSGNRNISCGTCHHHDFAGGDGLSLGIGEGGSGVGPERRPGTGPDAILKRIPRNAPALWNLGAKSVRVLFHDGRIETSEIYGNGFDTPAEEFLPQGLNSILAAQALFPLTSQFEMAGQPGENEVAGAVNQRIDRAWPVLAKRVRTIPEYGARFVQAFDTVETPQDVTIVEIANALAAFIGTEWQSYDSPYDAYLTHGTPLPDRAEAGRRLFFGDAGCSRCHTGPLLSDQQFHALGLPAFGPGRTRPFDPVPRDVGRMGATDDLEDAYRFRTPSLRNVALTAPYGHNGAYPSLRAMIGHVADPVTSRQAWQPSAARLPDLPGLHVTDFVIRSDRFEMARQARALDLEAVALSAREIRQIEAFLHSLTGATAKKRPLGRPGQVPSGLPVD